MKRLMPILLVLSLSIVLFGGEKALVSISFEGYKEGRIPEGFKSSKSGKGTEGDWVVMIDETAPSPKKVLAQTSDEDLEYHFPVLIYEGSNLADGAVKVSFKAVSGRRDRAAGVIFRFLDQDNYYVLRANALEDNVDLYKFNNGKRKKIAWADVKVSSREWHTLKVEFKDTTIKGYYDDKLLI
ncbi:MAG: hypothetical protein HZA70_06935, partial [Planctomycetes bacterium]|nr:hypothetical protein [Planctomycetota bacterium]